MFVILVSYKKPIEKVDKYIPAHREFLDEGYKNNYFVASGPKNPRSGGVIISQLSDRNQLEKILENDPFKIQDLADYEIIEFTPTKYHKHFASLLNASK